MSRWPILQSLLDLPRATLWTVLRIVLVYAVFASLWILGSDLIAERLLSDPDHLRLAQSLKGLLFVTLTTLLLAWVLVRLAARASDARTGHAFTEALPASRRPLAWALAGLALLFITLGGLMTVQEHHEQGQEARVQLQTLAHLKADQVSHWLESRRADARLASGSPYFNETLARGLPALSPAERQAVQRNLERFRDAYHYQSLLLVDRNGAIQIGTNDHGHGLGPEVRQALTRAQAEGQVTHTDLFLVQTPAPAHAHLDFIAPLRTDAGDALGALILRANLDQGLFALLNGWPHGDLHAESHLFQAAGTDLLMLTELQPPDDAPLGRRLSEPRADLLAAQALRPGYRAGTLIEGVDIRNQPSIGFAHPIPGTTWWLMTQLNRSAIRASASLQSIWPWAVVGLGWLASAALLVTLLQRRELAFIDKQRQVQTERIEALSLLAAIVNSSADAIYAKDRNGRYMLFNRAASHFTGKPEAEVLGRDDSALFPADQARMLQDNDRRVLREGGVLSYEEPLSTPDGPRTFLATKGPLRDADGQVFGLYGIARDITDRQRTEADLRAKNAALERFNQAMVGRELDMIRLKREINALAAELGRAPPYDLTALDSPAPGDPA
ncbi:MAG: PAS domain-containing protein [Pseudomonadota bacterium]